MRRDREVFVKGPGAFDGMVRGPLLICEQAEPDGPGTGGNRSEVGRDGPLDGPGVGGDDKSETTYVAFTVEHPASGVGVLLTEICLSGVVCVLRHFLVGG